ncbi:ABC transporter ATP-binding protein [Chryseomicrobium palamuruense]|uniref:ABC transporter ATP-binding protein n=1 Tax=Chryseomicrobium palamuruense TaxID=682973 RepID=A0ABV8USU2_9BACL
MSTDYTQQVHYAAMRLRVRNVMRVREAIVFQNVTFAYPEEEEKQILDQISFTIHAGEKWLIKGPSGCGKSTLFYLVNGLYPDVCDGIVSGERTLFGEPYASFLPGQVSQQIATVFQDPDSQFCMPTVEEELAFTLENRSVPRDEMDGEITRVLEETGLTAFRNRVIQTLSGGEKQRVATACALLMKPSIFLLDEPLAHLDPVTARDYVEWFGDLQKRNGWTVLVIDHQADVWGDFFDVVYELSSIHSSEKSRESYRPKPITTRFEYTARLAALPIVKEAEIHLVGGEITVLAGPNGSGKSTLLKALAGIIRSSGSRSMDAIGYVPQSPEFLFLTPSVRGEVQFGGGKNTDSLLALLQLESVADANPFAVSQGQKRRTAVAAMLNDGHPVLLLDEPTAGQDSFALSQLEYALKVVAAEGNALLVVTHDMAFASRIANHLLLMKNGEVQGPFCPDKVFSSPDILEAYRLLAPKGSDTDANLATSYESVR